MAKHWLTEADTETCVELIGDQKWDYKYPEAGRKEKETEE